MIYVPRINASIVAKGNTYLLLIKRYLLHVLNGIRENVLAIQCLTIGHVALERIADERGCVITLYPLVEYARRFRDHHRAFLAESLATRLNHFDVDALVLGLVGNRIDNLFRTAGRACGSAAGAYPEDVLFERFS